MLRIVFVENRGKTAFWVKVAERLRVNGHSIGWIVQNPVYTPNDRGEIIRLPFPDKNDLVDTDIPKAAVTDRGRNYFQAGASHYAHYELHINAALNQLRPDVIIGEPTLFHELLIVAEAKRRNIPYLHPTMTRYPGGRFAIFEGDTQNPVATSGEFWSEERLRELVQAIAEARAMPSYMAVHSTWRARIFKINRLIEQLKTFYGRLRGEIYNTPSLGLKRKLERDLAARLEVWKTLERLPDPNNPAVMYPLQMQPEANIDVWGRPYSDQVEYVRHLLAALPQGGQIAVKANPKSKYELSQDLISLAKSEQRIVLLPLAMRMPEAHTHVIGAVTVTGTVGYEAVFGRGRCISLRHPILKKHFPQFHADSPALAVARLLNEGEAGRGDVETGMDFVFRLINESFEGIISDLLYFPESAHPDNIEKVAKALEIAFSQNRRASDHMKDTHA